MPDKPLYWSKFTTLPDIGFNCEIPLLVVNHKSPFLSSAMARINDVGKPFFLSKCLNVLVSGK